MKVANFHDAADHKARIDTDARELKLQVDLDAKMREAIDVAASAAHKYLSSLKLFNRDGDDVLRATALEAIDKMESSLVDATWRHD